jgi:hypothetical protein
MENNASLYKPSYSRREGVALLIQSDMRVSPRELRFHGWITAKQEQTFGKNDLVQFGLSQGATGTFPRLAHVFSPLSNVRNRCAWAF